MRIGAAAAKRALRADPERWLYPLLELDTPFLAAGISCYAADGGNPADGFALIADYDEGVTARMYGVSTSLFEEAASDPAIGAGTRFCFFGELPPLLRGKDGFSAGGVPMRRGDSRRTLERHGLFGVRSARLPAPLPAGCSIAEAEPGDFRVPALLTAPRGGIPAVRTADGDRLWVASEGECGRPVGYLWATEAGPAFYDIVNIYVTPDARGRGIGKALAARYATEALVRGRRAYYGYAVSPESAALARSAGFRELWGETVSFFASEN